MPILQIRKQRFSHCPRLPPLEKGLQAHPQAWRLQCGWRGGPGESAPRERIRKAEEFPSAPPLPHLAVLGRALISLGQKGDWERLCPRGPGCAP